VSTMGNTPHGITRTVSRGYSKRPTTLGSSRSEKWSRIPWIPFGVLDLCMLGIYLETTERLCVFGNAALGWLDLARPDPTLPAAGDSARGPWDSRALEAVVERCR
jgi:hypothetical protein